MAPIRRSSIVAIGFLVGATALIGCGSDGSGSAGCPEEVPTPVLEVGGQPAALTLGVMRVCDDGEAPGSLHGDGPAVFGDVAVVDLTGELVVRADPDWDADVRWTGGGTVESSAGTWTLDAPPYDGCFRVSVALDHGSAGADWQALVRSGGVSVPCDRNTVTDVDEL